MRTVLVLGLCFLAACTVTPPDGACPGEPAPDRESPAGFLHVQALAASAPGTVVEAGSFGVFRSTDGGRTWTDITGSLPITDGLSAPGNASALAIARRDPSRIYLALRERGLFRTLDAGSTWTELTVGNGDFSAIELDDDLGGSLTVVGRTDGAVWSSADRGDNWTAGVAMQPALGSILSVARTGDTVWVGLEAVIDYGYAYDAVRGGIYTSTTGSTWTSAIDGLGRVDAVGDIQVPEFVSDISELSPHPDAGAFVALSGSQLYTRAGQAPWTKLDTTGIPTIAAFDSFGEHHICEQRVQTVSSFTRSAADPDHLYAGTYAFGVYERPAGATTWTRID